MPLEEEGLASHLQIHYYCASLFQVQELYQQINIRDFELGQDEPPKLMIYTNL